MLYLREKTVEILRKWGRTVWVTLLCALALNAGVSAAHRAMLQRGIAEEILRFHVLANSDSEEDQRIKYLVRDAVLEWFAREEAGQMSGAAGAGQVGRDGAGQGGAAEAGQIGTDGAGRSGAAGAEQVGRDGAGRSGVAEAGQGGADVEDKAGTAGTKSVAGAKESEIQFLAGHLREAEQEADRVLREQGASYFARASIENCYFPERTYGELTFPAGWYDALRIRLGKAEGRNWWCVLYPNLCFSDCLHAAAGSEETSAAQEGSSGSEEKSDTQEGSSGSEEISAVQEGISAAQEGSSDLKEILTAEEYESLLRKPQEWHIAFRWF